MNDPLLLEMRGVSKRFPGVVALDAVNLEVGHGEVVALVGENGAGKSTLMKILGGVYQPDAGELRIDGRLIQIHNVTDAMRLGIAFIHQELNVLDNLDVAANVFLGREPVRTPFRLIDQKKIHADTEPYLTRLGLNISSRTRLNTLSIAHRQMVEIAKALSLNARLIIMDEPTSSLTLSETARLLELVAELRKQGVSVIYISHRLGEVNQCADRVVVLRDGQNAGQLSKGKITHDRLVNMMVGREIKSFYVESQARRTPGFFRVRHARSSLHPDKVVSFDAAQGEILGFAGLVGAGRSEIAKAIVRLDDAIRGKRSGRTEATSSSVLRTNHQVGRVTPCAPLLPNEYLESDDGAHGVTRPTTAFDRLGVRSESEVWLGYERLSIRNARDAIEHGIYLVPEDRRAEGLVVEMSVRENISLPSLRRFARFGLIRRDQERATAEQQVSARKIKTPDTETRVLNLSGGNQQKVVLGKWLAMQPKVMILDEPTRGIDVGAKAEIYQLMRSLAEQGTVILMISSDMEEILHVSDRVAVMHEGEITGVLERADCTEENVMQLAVGRRIPFAKAAFAE